MRYETERLRDTFERCVERLRTPEIRHHEPVLSAASTSGQAPTVTLGLIQTSAVVVIGTSMRSRATTIPHLMT